MYTQLLYMYMCILIYKTYSFEILIVGVAFCLWQIFNTSWALPFIENHVYYHVCYDFSLAYLRLVGVVNSTISGMRLAITNLIIF